MLKLSRRGLFRGVLVGLALPLTHRLPTTPLVPDRVSISHTKELLNRSAQLERSLAKLGEAVERRLQMADGALPSANNFSTQ